MHAQKHRAIVRKRKTVIRITPTLSNHRDDSPWNRWKGFVSTSSRLALPDPSLGVAQKSSNSDEFCNNDRATARLTNNP